VQRAGTWQEAPLPHLCKFEYIAVDYVIMTNAECSYV
jgi:hypothetical protein